MIRRGWLSHRALFHALGGEYFASGSRGFWQHVRPMTDRDRRRGFQGSVCVTPLA